MRLSIKDTKEVRKLKVKEKILDISDEMEIQSLLSEILQQEID